jgi:hypothetical protein
MRTYADGQLAAAAAALFTAGQDLNYPSDGSVSVSLSLCNTSGASAETVTITFQRQGGTARRIARVVLAANETATIQGIPMAMGDILLGVATDATTVDYLVGNSGGAPFAISTFDSSGQLKQTNGTSITGATTLTSASATALTVGRLGATTPAFSVDASAAVQVTGLKVVGNAAGAGLAISLVGGNAAESMTIDAKGTGTLTLQGTATGIVIISRAVSAVGVVNTGVNTTSVGASTAAAGTNTLGDATALPAGTAEVYPTTAADDTKAVKIHANDKVTGRKLFIGNGVANKILNVFGPSGAAINGAAADASFPSASGKGVTIVCLSGAGNTWLAA